MAASITANPNPVGLWSAADKGTTTITWSIGVGSPGARPARVYRSVDGGAEQQFDGFPNGAIGNTIDDTTIQLGHSYTYVVRDAGNNAALASVTVTTVDILQQQIDAMAEAAILVGDPASSQAIINVSVVPGVETVRITFQTTQPTIPEITCETTDGTPAPGWFPIFGGEQRKHDCILVLEQDTGYRFQIRVMGKTWYFGPLQNYFFHGQFSTGTRTATVSFDRIKVTRDGDPSHSGEFQFGFAVRDPDAPLSPLATSFFPSSNTIDISDNDPPVDVNQVLTAALAPTQIWLGVLGQDEDEPAFTWGLSAGGLIPPLETAETGWTESTGFDESWIGKIFDIGQVASGTELPFDMATGDFGVAFSVSGRIRVDTVIPPGFKARPVKRPIKPNSWLITPGDLAHIGTSRVDTSGAGGKPGGKSGRTYAVALVANSLVYKPIDPGKSSPRNEGWTRMAGEVTLPVNLLATTDGRLNIFAFDRDGGVIFQSPKGTREVPWRKLGGRFRGSVTSAEGAKGQIEVFGLSEEGVVFHTSVGPDAKAGKDNWQRIGAAVAGSLTAVSFPDGSVGVFAIGQNGEVLHKVRRRNKWSPAAAEWRSLGKANGGRLTARAIDRGGVAVGTLSDGDAMQLLLWRNYPEGRPAPWKKCGTVDAWLDARPRRVRGGSSAPKPSKAPKRKAKASRKAGAESRAARPAKARVARKAGRKRAGKR
jgi:hypothetical protein